MTTTRPELSEKNIYWISKHRYYELKHFCLQYKDWKEAYSIFSGSNLRSPNISSMPRSTDISDLTAHYASMCAYYSERIDMLERAAKEADPYIHSYILKAVTEDLSYTQLKSRLELPCSKGYYYERYRKFFHILSHARK